MKNITEKTLRNLALISSSLGLLLLFFVSQNLEPEITKIGEITPESLGSNVKVCGIIENKFVSSGNHTFFDLKDESGKIKVVVFESISENLEKFEINVLQLGDGDEICVLGEVDEWEWELEVKAKKIELS